MAKKGAERPAVEQSSSGQINQRKSIQEKRE